MRPKGARPPKTRKVKRYQAGTEAIAALAAIQPEVPYGDRTVKIDLTPERLLSFCGAETEQAVLMRKLHAVFGNPRSKER